MFDFVGNIAIAAAVTALGVSSMATTAKAMDDVTIAGVYAVDRSLCQLYVPQDSINRHLANVVVQYDISPSEALMEAARIGTVLKEHIEQSGRVTEYCAARTKR